MSWRDRVDGVAAEVLDHARATSERLRQLGILREGEDPQDPHGLAPRWPTSTTRTWSTSCSSGARSRSRGWCRAHWSAPSPVPVVGARELVQEVWAARE